jgi:hypothetical protein
LSLYETHRFAGSADGFRGAQPITTTIFPAASPQAPSSTPPPRPGAVARQCGRVRRPRRRRRCHEKPSRGRPGSASTGCVPSWRGCSMSSRSEIRFDPARRVAVRARGGGFHARRDAGMARRRNALRLLRPTCLAVHRSAPRIATHRPAPCAARTRRSCPPAARSPAAFSGR